MHFHARAGTYISSSKSMCLNHQGLSTIPLHQFPIKIPACQGLVLNQRQKMQWISNHLHTLYIDPVNMPVASSMIDLTHVLPELGMLERAMGEEGVKGMDKVVEKFWHVRFEELSQGKCLTCR